MLELFVVLWIFSIIIAFDGIRRIDDEPDVDSIWRVIEFLLGTLFVLVGDAGACIYFAISKELSILPTIILAIVFTLCGIALSICAIAVALYILSLFDPSKKETTRAPV